MKTSSQPALRPQVLTAAEQSLPAADDALARARAFAAPLLLGQTLDTGEATLAHADAVAHILAQLGGSPAMQAASYLVYACEYLKDPAEVIRKAFGDTYAELALQTTRLVRVQRQARAASQSAQLVEDPKVRVETVRKMLLAFSSDLRVVLLRLASRLQTLRWFAASGRSAPAVLAHESLHVFAPLANRLGIWQIKWELEDLSFRFLEPATYREIASLLDAKRVQREADVQALRDRIHHGLRGQGIEAEVQGRPKHIYSIVRKMRGKGLPFDRVLDVRALRVIVPTVRDCYAALAWVHAEFAALAEEFDDYIARPKPNGYQSLHTVVRDAGGAAAEVQIRTRAMHEHAEHGVAAHWAYKEAGARGYAGVSADSAYDARIAVLRQLLAWKQDLAGEAAGLFDDRIYVLTPDAAVLDLPVGATPVDFAYAVHTELGHRCRGARVDGAMVPLNTPLANGQTVHIVAAKEGGPSRDWLNPELAYLASPRARAKVRAWFNAQAHSQTQARGREAVEKLLQREGRTALKLDELAARLGFKAAEQLFEAVGKDEFSLRNIEALLRPTVPPPAQTEVPPRRGRAGGSPQAAVLVVGLDSLMTHLARCCKPAPPDAIAGFVTRGRGVSVHRAECPSLREAARREPDRVIDTQWGDARAAGGVAPLYPVDVAVQALDRQGLLRDISEVFAREKMNVIGVQTQSVRDTAWMTFTLQVSDTTRLGQVLRQVAAVPGVRSARRR